jgi:predicted  nucleic acid-binding Zn-ribbon protein
MYIIILFNIHSKMFSKMEEEFQKIMQKIEELEIGHREYRAKLANISTRLEEENKQIKTRIKQFEKVCVHHSISL